MGVPSIGEIVLIPFPFSDPSQTKVRPAVCIADAGRGDWILCQITSNPYGDPLSIHLDPADFEQGGLRLASYARPGKIFTADRRLLIRAVGRLDSPSIGRILDAVVALLRPSAKA